MPWLVYFPFPVGCTGSIIGKRHVLTAKHCYKPIIAPKYYVIVGAHDYKDVEKGIGPGRKILVEKWDLMSDRDIAVLTLLRILQVCCL